MRRQHTSTADASGLIQHGWDADPATVLVQIDEFAKPEMFSRLVDLALSGRNDRGLDSCAGPTWTNVAHRALELMGWLLSEYGAILPSADLDRILRVRAVGVNWVRSGEARGAGRDDLNNAGIFEFETSRLRRAAWDLLQERQDQQSGEDGRPNPEERPSLPLPSLPPSLPPPPPTFDDASSVMPSASKGIVSRMRPVPLRPQASEPSSGLRDAACGPLEVATDGPEVAFDRAEAQRDTVTDELQVSSGGRSPASDRSGPASGPGPAPDRRGGASDRREGALERREAALDRREGVPDPEAALRPEAAPRSGALPEEQEDVSGGVDVADDAIAREQKMLRRFPTAAKPYRTLCEAHLEKGNVDAAFCAAQVLCFLGMAREQEQKLFEKHRPKGVLQVTGSLHEELWRTKLQHPDEDLELGRIFEMLADPALRLRIGLTKAPEPYGDSPEAFKQETRVCRVMVRMFAWAAAAFGVTAPRLLVSQSQPNPLFVVASRDPTSLVGLAGVSGKNPRELAFLVGRHLGGCRSGYGHRTRSLLPDPGLLAGLLGGAVRRIGSQAKSDGDGDEPASNQFSTGRLLGSAHIDALRPLMRSYARRGASADIGRWVRAVQLTDCRAGYLLSGDMAAAAAMIHADQAISGGLSAEESVEELMVFSVSPEHLALRAALGAAVRVAR